ncbi:MAG: PfkB family carbohydrate kinase [Bacillota bacterium]
MNHMYDVLALGELLIDFTPAGYSVDGNQLFEANPGGAPANVLACLAKFGMRTALIGKVGDDEFGHLLRRVLEERRIDSQGLVLEEWTVHELETSIRFANAVGALVVTRRGGIPAMPTLAEVQALLARPLGRSDS